MQNAYPTEMPALALLNTWLVAMTEIVGGTTV
jgi:hypothetical protein